jgi:hypothetical protein
MDQIKTHVIPGSSWSPEEEKAVFVGFMNRKTAEEIAETFPTDRNPESIRMKLGNHKWEDTNGQDGLRGGNKWVKQRWAHHRAHMIPFFDKQIKELEAELSHLYSETDRVRNRLKYYRERMDDMTTLPN